jgi:nitrogen regulatory protein P-II 1
MTPHQPAPVLVELVRLEAVVRPDVLDRVVHAVRDAGAVRLSVMQVHAIGAGADPETARLSLLEGSAFAQAHVVQVICPASLAQTMTQAILAVARTGRRGDGIIVESPLTAVTKIRTGERGADALR